MAEDARRPMRVAVDGMGSDRAPGPEVVGALRAVRSQPIEVFLVGDQAKLQEELTRAGRTAEDASEAAEPADGGEGAEIAEEDLDLFPYDGDAIDLEPLFREQFVLAVPFAPLCREDCKGLCPQCGIDRNTGTCSCEPPIDPRLAALKGLKLPP